MLSNRQVIIVVYSIIIEQIILVVVYIILPETDIPIVWLSQNDIKTLC